MSYTLKFKGGSKDGLELIDENDMLPDVIDGHAVHIFNKGQAYVKREVNHDSKTAYYEPVDLTGIIPPEGLYSEDDP